MTAPAAEAKREQVLGLIDGGRRKGQEFWDKTGGVRKMFIRELDAREMKQNAHEKKSKGLTYEDALALEREATLIELVEPTMTRPELVRVPGFEKQLDVSGATPSYEPMYDFHPAEGRFITQEDLARNSKVVVLTSFGEESRILDALNAGAVGYLLKHTDPDSLIDAVRSAQAGDAPLDPRAGRVLLDQRRREPTAPDLMPRELEVLQLVGDGLANKQIARRLGITERTVKAHLTSVFQRIGVSDRTQAALWAKRNGLG